MGKDTCGKKKERKFVIMLKGLRKIKGELKKKKQKKKRLEKTRKIQLE